MPLGEGINPCSANICKDVGHAEPLEEAWGAGSSPQRHVPATLTLSPARRARESAHRGRHKTVTRTRLAMCSCLGPLSPSTITPTNDPLPHGLIDVVPVLLKGDRLMPEYSR
jgi:hypothetical protein